MFNMKIDKQLNIQDRTLLLGVPNYDVIPKIILVDDDKYSVIGISHGVNPPYLSLEIEKTASNLEGKSITV